MFLMPGKVENFFFCFHTCALLDIYGSNENCKNYTVLIFTTTDRCL